MKADNRGFFRVDAANKLDLKTADTLQTSMYRITGVSYGSAIAEKSEAQSFYKIGII